MWSLTPSISPALAFGYLHAVVTCADVYVLSTGCTCAVTTILSRHWYHDRDIVKIRRLHSSLSRFAFGIVTARIYQIFKKKEERSFMLTLNVRCD